MTRSSRRHPGVQPERPTPPSVAVPEASAHETAQAEPRQPLSRQWRIVIFLWIAAVAALALFEFLQALFRLF
jgi:hypothetical protein